LATLNSGQFSAELIKYLVLLPTQLTATYILIYVQVPKFSMKKKYLLFFLSLILLGYIFSAMARFSMVHIAEPLFRKDFVQESLLEILSDVYYLLIVYFPSVYGVAFIFLMIHTLKKRTDAQQQIEILQKEKATNELKFLRAQIQPHFLFNTLNNLYALTLTKSDLAPQVVLKLSEMLDFILYQSNQVTISIEKEIELIQGFIDLESLRYGDILKINFEYKTDNALTKISPLILLPFVENAFKHGAAGNNEDPTIDIQLKVENQRLDFRVFNNKPKGFAEQKENISGGIGTQNLKRQLELNYAGEYNLNVQNSNEEYIVSLTLNLNQ
jgi:LytS/YehU family sensor histidine kinase